MKKIPSGYGMVQTAVMKHPQLTIQSKAIYCFLASMSGGKDFCWPTVETICNAIHLSRPMVIGYLQELESFELIKKSRLYTNSAKTNHKYEVFILDENAAKSIIPRVHVKPIINAKLSQLNLESKADLTSQSKADLTHNNNIRIVAPNRLKKENRPETKVPYSQNFKDDIQFIRDSTSLQFRNKTEKQVDKINKFYNLYKTSIDMTDQETVSRAIRGYAKANCFFTGDAKGKWNFEKLLRNDNSLDKWAVAGQDIIIKEKLIFPCLAEIRKDPKGTAFKIRTDFTYIEIRKQMPTVFEEWKNENFFTGIFEDLIFRYLENEKG